MYSFSVYRGFNLRLCLRGAKLRKAKIGYEVVNHLMWELHNCGHHVLTNNLFTSIYQTRIFSTSPLHTKFTQWMHKVDVSDQLRGVYSCQVRSKKRWHKLFFFLLDKTIVNACIGSTRIFVQM